jgi:hypothetical protein
MNKTVLAGGLGHPETILRRQDERLGSLSGRFIQLFGFFH